MTLCVAGKRERESERDEEERVGRGMGSEKEGGRGVGGGQTGMEMYRETGKRFPFSLFVSLWHVAF